VRIAVAETREADAGEPFFRAGARVGFRRAGDLQPDRDVLERGLPGKQRLGLEQVTGQPVEAGQALAEAGCGATWSN